MHILICHIIHEAAKGYTKPLERKMKTTIFAMP